MRRCKHLWQEVNRTFSPPLTNIKKFSGYDSDLIKTAMYGMTVVELQCIHCGDIRFETTSGKA